MVEQHEAVTDLINQYGGAIFVVPARPRYHLEECRYVAGRAVEALDVREVLKDGYTPCGVCRPDEKLFAAAKAKAAAQTAVPVEQAPVPSSAAQPQRAPIAVTTDGLPIVQPRRVPPGMAQPLGELPDGSPVWPVPVGTGQWGAARPYGLTSAGEPVWTRPASGSQPAWRRKRVLVPAAVVGFLLVVGIAGGGGDRSTTVRQTSDSSAHQTLGEPEAAADKAAADKAAADKAAADKAAADKAAADKAAAEEAAAETVGQENAREAASNYLDFTAFSRSGLIKQLKFEGYSTADATYGVDSQKADWNKQAAKAAENYLDFTAFSRSGLISQLMFEGYTRAQAEYGVKQAGL